MQIEGLHADACKINPGEAVTLSPLTGAVSSEGAQFVEATLQLWDGKEWTKKVVQPGVGTWVVKQGKVQFMPAKDFIGVAKAPYRVQDTAGLWGRSMLKVLVEPVAELIARPTMLPKTGASITNGVSAALILGLVGSVLIAFAFRQTDRWSARR